MKLRKHAEQPNNGRNPGGTQERKIQTENAGSQGAKQDPETGSHVRTKRVGVKQFGEVFVAMTRSFPRSFRSGFAQFAASLTFYTSLPFFQSWSLEFRRIARFAPLVGLLIGFLLGAIEFGLAQLQVPLASRTAIVIVSWIALTGGLHLDGAMDTADGLAVTEPRRRLTVMADSVTGAFGVMVAIAIMLLKFSALLSLPLSPPVHTAALMAAAGWGRWAQVLAIARYPYLKPQGKGAFHKNEFQRWDLWPGLFLLLGLSALYFWLFPFRWMMALGMVLGGFAIAFSTGAWFNHKLGGHTGDTYGAVVEWTEAILLCLLTMLQP